MAGAPNIVTTVKAVIQVLLGSKVRSLLWSIFIGLDCGSYKRVLLYKVNYPVPERSEGTEVSKTAVCELSVLV